VKNIDTSSKDDLKSNVVRLEASAEELYVLLENLLIWSAHQRGALAYAPEPIDVHEIAVYHTLLFTPQAEPKKDYTQKFNPGKMWFMRMTLW